MHEVRLGQKGQVTLPKAIRDHYRLSKGDHVRMVDLGNGIMEVILLQHSRDLPPPVIQSSKGASTETMEKAASEGAAARYKNARHS